MSAHLVKEVGEHPSYFSGFPYLVTQLVTTLYHIALLPESLGLEKWIEIATRQVKANILLTCLVLNSERCIYFYPDGTGVISAKIPRGSFIVINGLKLSEEFEESEELTARKKDLLEYEVKVNGMVLKYIAGDLKKGGRVATQDELIRLDGQQPNGVPIGLTQCGTCHEWKGQCLDPSPNFKGILMNVICSCQNDTRCARCGKVLYHHQLSNNYYTVQDNHIWHVPGFCGLHHECDKNKA